MDFTDQILQQVKIHDLQLKITQLDPKRTLPIQLPSFSAWNLVFIDVGTLDKISGLLIPFLNC